MPLSYALTCGRARICVTGGTTGAFSASLASAQDAEDASGTNKRKKAIAALLEGCRFALKEALHEDGTMTAVDPTQVVDLLAKFSGSDLTATLSRIERSVRGLTALGTAHFFGGDRHVRSAYGRSGDEASRGSDQCRDSFPRHPALPATYPRSRRAS
jgi:hypothetical protein